MLQKLAIPVVNCLGCQYYEATQYKSTMYCHKAKMPMRYKADRRCANKVESIKTDKK